MVETVETVETVESVESVESPWPLWDLCHPPGAGRACEGGRPDRHAPCCGVRHVAAVVASGSPEACWMGPMVLNPIQPRISEINGRLDGI